MKKILIVLLVSVFFASCETYKVHTIPLNYVNVWDYTLLTNDGIFVTESNSVGFDYQTIGSIYIELREGERKEANDSYYTVRNKRDGSKSDKKESQYVRYTPRYVVLKIGEELKKIDANGIINLKITYDKNYQVVKETTSGNKVTEVIRHGSGYIVTGMAIKK